MAAAAETTLADIDLDRWVEGVPSSWFARLRREEPVFCQDEREGRRFWSLTRYELRVFLEEALPSLERLELAGPPERLRSNFFHGLKRMPVRYRRP